LAKFYDYLEVSGIFEKKKTWKVKNNYIGEWQLFGGFLDYL